MSDTGKINNQFNLLPRIIPDGMEVYEYCLQSRKIRKAEWQAVPRKVRLLTRILIYFNLVNPPRPLSMLVEYEDCLYIPAQDIKIATKQFKRIIRMKGR